MEIDGVRIGVDTILPNRLVRAMLEAHAIPRMGPYETVRPEYPHVAGSRVDFRLAAPGLVHDVEVKNCHLVYPDCRAYFPDSVSLRATKHLLALIKERRRGIEATVLVIGWLLGGTVGVGTVLFALLIGPAVGYGLRLAGALGGAHGEVLDDEHPSIGFDNYEIGQILANYLLDLGHRNFGVIAQESLQSDRATKRVAGILDTVKLRGVPVPSQCFVSRSHTIVNGQLAFKSLMESAIRPTAVICGTDMLAFGAMVQATSMGIRIPNDVSITGINDVEFAAHLSPPLTTVKLPADVVGQRAAEFLLGRIHGEPVVNTTTIPFSLIARGSTGMVMHAK
jgi:hypothetical protein